MIQIYCQTDISQKKVAFFVHLVLSFIYFAPSFIEHRHIMQMKRIHIKASFSIKIETQHAPLLQYTMQLSFSKNGN